MYFTIEQTVQTYKLIVVEAEYMAEAVEKGSAMIERHPLETSTSSDMACHPASEVEIKMFLDSEEQRCQGGHKT